MGGIAIVVIGVWTLIDKSFIEVLLRNNLFMSATYIMICSGIISTCVAVIGLIGAVKVRAKYISFILIPQWFL